MNTLHLRNQTRLTHRALWASATEAAKACWCQAVPPCTEPDPRCCCRCCSSWVCSSTSPTLKVSGPPAFTWGLQCLCPAWFGAGLRLWLCLLCCYRTIPSHETSINTLKSAENTHIWHILRWGGAKIKWDLLLEVAIIWWHWENRAIIHQNIKFNTSPTHRNVFHSIVFFP